MTATEKAEARKELLALDMDTANTKAGHAVDLVSHLLDIDRVLTSDETEAYTSALDYLVIYFEKDHEVADKPKVHINLKQPTALVLRDIAKVLEA